MVCNITSMINVTIDPLLNNSPDTEDIPSAVYLIFTMIVFVIFVFGLVQNSLTIYVFAREKCLQKVHNVFIVSLAVDDLCMCVLGVWMVLVSGFFKTWMFGRAGCVYYGFTTTLLGISQISLLAAIAIDRYLVIVKSSCIRTFNNRSAAVVICCCYGYGFFWALLPAIGWSSYQLEGIRMRCAIDWRSKKPSDASYTLTLMVLAWVVPLCAILYCYIGIYMLIRRDGKKPIRTRTGSVSKRINRERRVAVTVFLMISAFFLSWTPYSIVTLVVKFGGTDYIPLSLTFVPALCAKTSIIWNPVIYVARHSDFRRACVNILPFSRQAATVVTLINTPSNPSRGTTSV